MSLARSSAGLILVKKGNKPTSKYDYQMLMVKRNPNLRAFPGFHAFPGGSLDKGDQIGQEWNSVLKSSIQTDTHMKLAALRELYEETNIFLGQDKYLPTDTTVEDRKDSHWFRQHCEKSGYVPPLARLIPFSRWVSPLQMEKVRFDTTFYLAEVDELEIVHQKLTTTELVSLDWQSPDYFMEKSETQEVKLPPPTWTKLQEIIQHTHMDDLFAYAKQKVIKVVQPCLKQSDAGLIVVFVGDEAYELETAAETALTQGKVGDRNRIYATTPFKWERNIVSDIPYTQLPTPKL